MRKFKTFCGLMGFFAVVALSFLIISDVEKSLIFFDISYDEPACEGYTTYMYIYTPPIAPAPPVNEPVAPPPEPTPRVTIREADVHMLDKGYAYTVFARFAENYAAFHVAEDVEIHQANETIIMLVDMFDIFWDNFPGAMTFEYFIEAEPGNIFEREIYYNLDFNSGTIAFLYFSQRYYMLPQWLSIGLELYFIGGGANFLGDIILSENLQAHDLPFGDAWFIPLLSDTSHTQTHDISYTLVRRWFETGVLYDLVRLAQENPVAFALSTNEYLASFAKDSPFYPMQFLYLLGNFKVLTDQGGYIFVDDNYEWTWAGISDFILYMDAAIEFIRDYFHINDSNRIEVTLYPFGVIDIPDSIAHLADVFGWEAPDVNFATYHEIILASTSRFGTWAIAHEAVHLFLFREFYRYNPPTWMVEGMAVLGELLFREAFDGTLTYSFKVPTISNIHTLSRGRAGHSLPFRYGEADFGREIWTYDDAGSFMLYLYNHFGIDLLLELYQTDNYSQFDLAYILFGVELTELMDSWRRYLWPAGEPEGWW